MAGTNAMYRSYHNITYGLYGRFIEWKRLQPRRKNRNIHLPVLLLLSALNSRAKPQLATTAVTVFGGFFASLPFEIRDRTIDPANIKLKYRMIGLIFVAIFGTAFVASYVIIFSRDVTFPAVVNGQREKGTKDTLEGQITQLVLIIIFFSFLCPLGNIIMAKTATMVFNSQFHQTYVDAKERPKFMRAIQIMVNMNFDIARYMLGRGVLMRVSSSLFFAILAKDIFYTFYQFGIRFHDSTYIFLFRSLHPDGDNSCAAYSKNMQRIVRVK